VKFCLFTLLLLAACAEPALPDEGCEQDLDCPRGQRCVDGGCVDGGPRCEPGFESCDGGCVDLTRDASHCGACANACATGVGCLDGACCPAEAPSLCGGACVDPTSDARHCSGCGAACDPGDVCSAAHCCPEGTSFCGYACTDLSRDPSACGACGNVCPAGAACVDGACAACPDGTELVDCGAVRACLPPLAPRDPCMLEVPAATFEMGWDDPETDGYPVHEVTISRGFLLDLHEVTMRDYAACVEAGACVVIGVLDPVLAPFDPAGFLGHADAAAFCAFRGDRLPTEAEWELAARGTDGRNWPWGDERPTCDRANFNECGSNVRPTGLQPSGAGPYGHLDLSGNISEWVADVFGPYPAEAVIDPLGPTEGPQRVRRGGHFDSGSGTSSATHRDPTPLDYFDPSTGARCARDLP